MIGKWRIVHAGGYMPEPYPEVEQVRAQIGRVKAALLKEESQRARTLFDAASGLCIAAHTLVNDLANQRAATNGQPIDWSTCHHEWREVDGNSPDGQTPVRCHLCRCPGERSKQHWRCVLACHMMVYWRFIRDAPSEWRVGYITWLANGLVRMGRWNMDSTYGPVVDPKEIEMKEYSR